jgi:hypothetical protein
MSTPIPPAATRRLDLPVSPGAAWMLAEKINLNATIHDPARSPCLPYGIGLADDVMALIGSGMHLAHRPASLFGTAFTAAEFTDLRRRAPYLWHTAVGNEPPPRAVMGVLRRHPALRVHTEFALLRNGTWQLSTTSIDAYMGELSSEDLDDIFARVRTCGLHFGTSDDLRWQFRGEHHRWCSCPGHWGPTTADYAFNATTPPPPVPTTHRPDRSSSPARDPTRRETPLVPTKTDTIRDPQGGRNMIRQGDIVRVRPSRPGARDGFNATFRTATVDDDGNVVDIEVYGGHGGRAAIRTLRPERIQRRAQTRHTDPAGTVLG